MNGEFDFFDTSNQFLVGTDAQRERVVINQYIGGALTRKEALNLAGWIVALLDPEHKDFERLLAAIENA